MSGSWNCVEIDFSGIIEIFKTDCILSENRGLGHWDIITIIILGSELSGNNRVDDLVVTKFDELNPVKS